MVEMYSGPIIVTLAYLGVYYGFQAWQLMVKTRLRKEYAARGEKFDRYFNTDREMLAADRYVLNTLEHMPPFLVLLWLAAFFVNPVVATTGGALYVATRVVYPFLMGRTLGGAVSERVMYATFTGYFVLTYFAVRIALKLI
jgi:hypothetical protein